MSDGSLTTVFKMSSSSSEDEYIVERIIEKRYNSKKKHYEYLLKWVGYEENTWEPEHYLDCPKLFEEFKREEESKRKGSTSNRNASPTLPQINLTVPFGDTSTNNNNPDFSQSPSGVAVPDNSALVEPLSNNKHTNEQSACDANSAGVDPIDEEDPVEKILSELDNNHKPEKIIGATRNLGDISFLVKWKDVSEADLISHRVARIACPQSVIEYYEKNIRWNDSENES